MVAAGRSLGGSPMYIGQRIGYSDHLAMRKLFKVGVYDKNMHDRTSELGRPQAVPRVICK